MHEVLVREMSVKGSVKLVWGVREMSVKGSVKLVWGVTKDSYILLQHHCCLQ